MKWILKKFGYRHWYRFKLQYKDKDSQNLFYYTTSYGLKDVESILDHRSVKQTVPLHLVNGIPKHLLCNGKLELEPLCYLGFFKKKD
jgi:hypothetical protein